MEPTNRAFRFNLWLIFLAVGVGLVLFVAFYREGDLARESLTESEETRQSQAPTGREPTTRGASIETPDLTASKLVRAWNQGNSQEIADLFTSDGVLRYRMDLNFNPGPKLPKR